MADYGQPRIPKKIAIVAPFVGPSGDLAGSPLSAKKTCVEHCHCQSRMLMRIPVAVPFVGPTGNIGGMPTTN